MSPALDAALRMLAACDGTAFVARLPGKQCTALLAYIGDLCRAAGVPDPAVVPPRAPRATRRLPPLPPCPIPPSRRTRCP